MWYLLGHMKLSSSVNTFQEKTSPSLTQITHLKPTLMARPDTLVFSISLRQPCNVYNLTTEAQHSVLETFSHGDTIQL